MNYRIELHPQAAEELSESYHWYEQRSEGLGLRFIGSVDKRLLQIATDPERYPKRKGNFRETAVSVFHYVIIYETLKKQKIVFVYHIFHTKRNPKLKYKK